MSRKSSSAKPVSKLQTLQLEQRLMFDGAAVETTAELMSDLASDSDTVDTLDTGLFQLAVAYEQALPIAEQAQRQIKDYLSSASAEDLFAIFSGDKEQIDAQWLQSMESVRQAVLNDQFEIEVQLLDNASMQGNLGAFAAQGPDGKPVIYLNESYLENFSAELAAKVLVEEFGHAIDNAVNEVDTLGDEGQRFADAVSGVHSSEASAVEDDAGVLSFESGDITVEWASFEFAAAYKMVTDLNEDGVVDNNESWAEKEQETHYLIPSRIGTVEINDDTNSSQFSGNDVVAIGLNIGGTDYYGWISRPVKLQGEVLAFYFWTDVNFTSLELAQADGNQDRAAGDPGVSDNSGFILVVDETKFNAAITTTSTGVSYTLDDPATSVSDSTTYTSYYTIKSSSDRVDSALNTLVAAQTANTAPVAYDDASNLTLSPGASGGPALEEGADNNSPTLNTNTAAGNLTDGVDAVGNVFADSGETYSSSDHTNGVDYDADGDTLTISAIRGDTSGSSVAVTSTAAGTVSGAYGSLTINSDGSYTYSVDDANPTVDALRTTSNTLSDVFTYTVEDGRGGSDTATLTIVIQGSNDAPVAVKDYNTAKEELTLTEINEGYNASGNVLSNDTDVDSGDSKSIYTGGYTATATVDSYTDGSTSSYVGFVGGSGFQPSNVQDKVLYVWIDDDGNGIHDTYRAVHGLGSVDANGNPTANDGDYVYAISVTENPNNAGVYDIKLSEDVYYYVDKDGNEVRLTLTQLNGLQVGFKNDVVSNQGVVSNSPGDVDETEDTSSMKLATLTSAKYVSTTSLDISNLSDASGLLVGSTIFYDNNGTLVSTGITVTEIDGSNLKISGNTTDLTQGTAITFAITGNTEFELAGTHGTLTFNVNGVAGAYSYEATSNNDGFDDGDKITETFSYKIQDLDGALSQANLIIDVYGTSSSNAPVTTNDTVSVTEQGLDKNYASTDAGYIDVAGTGTSSSANLLSNDFDNVADTTAGVTNTYIASVQKTSDPSTVTTISTSRTTTAVDVAGLYGTLHVAGDGTYTYTLDDTNVTVDALAASETLSESFTYKASNGTQFSFGTLTVTINGSNDVVLAVDDVGTAYEDGVVLVGNVSSNDTDVDDPDTKTVLEFIKADVTSSHLGASTLSGGTSVSSSSNVTSPTATAVSGDWGDLKINADGSYLYTVNNSLAAIQALAVGETKTDVFTYLTKDSANTYSVATLTITIQGTNDVPVNSYPSSVSITDTTSTFSFTGGSLLSVADVDTDLTSVRLHVDYGTLSINSSYVNANATATLSDGGKTLTITGTTQADINAMLAQLQYDYSGGAFVNGDYLTIFSEDSQGGFDSDSVFISLPSALTVYEAGLDTIGSDASSTSDIVNEVIDLAVGRKVTDVSTTRTTLGTYSITNGVITYALNGAKDHSGGGSVTETFTYTSTDLDGTNPTTHAVTVTVVDDTPTATANTATVTEGGTVTGNVLTDGTADTFGADGAKTTSPTGGVIGVRASGGDTTTAVTSGADGTTSITGQYGSLVLDSDGSYTYTSTANAISADATDVFVYTIEDADGDRSTATLTISVTDYTISATANDIQADDQYAGVSGRNTFNTTITPSGGAGSYTFALASGHSDPSYGSFSVNSSGVVTFTQTAAYTHTSGSSSKDNATSADIVITDANGNTYTKTVYVDIADDTPTATANTKSVNEGGTATGNVLTDGTADSFGKDGAKTTSPIGGVIGVRASGGDTTTAVTSGADGTTSISGQYGSLVLDSDGSYTYTSTANAISADATDVFVYTIEDADGDRSTATLTINIANVANLGTIDVTGYGPVNEASPYAIFTVEATMIGQTLDLSLQNATSGTAATYSGFTYEYSTDGGSTWTTYSSSSKPTVPSDGKVYVRVDISSETDTAYEGSETFALKATYTNYTSIYDAANTSIIDDGTGTKYPGTISSGTPGSSTTSLDDDRAITVTGYGPVNEGSDYAVHKVVTTAGQSLDLELSNGTTYLSGETIEFSYNGTTWYTYTAGNKPTVPSNGIVYVRNTLASESDAPYEGAETFSLVAKWTNTPSITGSDTTTIVDDGTGTKYPGRFPSGTPQTNTANLDDDRPRVRVAPVPQIVAADPTPQPVARGADRVVEATELRPVQRQIEEVVEAPQGELLLNRDIPGQNFEAGDGFTQISFQIPSDTFGHTEPGAQIEISAIMADGRALPTWLVFDPAKGEFRGIPPRDFSGLLTIRVIARDDMGAEVETMVNVEVISGRQGQLTVDDEAQNSGEQASAEGSDTADEQANAEESDSETEVQASTESKPGLMNQLQSQSQFAWKAQRDELVKKARKLRS